MGKQLVWDAVGEHFFEAGVDKVALFPYKNNAYDKGVAWSGVTAINEKPSGAEATDQFADNGKYLVIRSAEDFGFTIEAFQSPKEFDACDGSLSIATGVSATQQTRQSFGLVYRSMVGNDTESTGHGYKIHIIYGATASPSAVDRSTINSTVEPAKLSWEAKTVPVAVPNKLPTAHIIIDSRLADKTKLTAFEKIIWGDEAKDAKLPTPQEIIAAFTA